MKTRPKILITAPSLDETENVSGISTVVRQIVGHGRFSYVHFTAGKKDAEKKTAAWIFKQIALPVRFFQTLKREKIDIAHINTAFNPLSILRDYALVAAARRARVPVLLHVHGGKFLAREFENKFLLNLAEKMLRRADRILVLSRMEKEIIETRWPHLTADFLENAIALEDFGETAKEKNSIIFLGRLTESKGLQEIIDAVKILAGEKLDFTFKAFGAGDLQEYFTTEMNRVLGEKFYFGGVISGSKKQNALGQSDIFVLPSRHGEGLPMALLEAMAARCIVVVSEMASIGAVVENGVNGFLIEPQNAVQLTATLRKILSAEADFETLRNRARETVAEKFNLRDYIEKLEKIYGEIYRKI